MSSENHNKAEKTKKKKGKDKPQKVDLYSWMYDDGSIGSVLKGEKGFFRPSYFRSDLEVDKERSWLATQEKKDELKVANKEKRYQFKAGVDDYRDDHSFPTKFPRQHFDAFAAMTTGKNREAQKTVMEIISVILANYMVRRIDEIYFEVDELKPEFVNPLYANISSETNAIYEIHKIVEAMAVDTRVDQEKGAKLCGSQIIPPPGGHGTRINDLVFYKIGGCKGYKWPLLYRDTTVLIDRNEIPPAQIKEFFRRNIWCGGIIYGRKTGLTFDFAAEGKGKALLGVGENFDAQAINKLASAYVAEVADCFDRGERWFTPRWKQAGTLLSNYIASRRGSTLNGAARFTKRLQLFAVLAFFEFIQDRCDVSDAEMKSFSDDRFNALFPGCVPVPSVQSAEAQKRETPEKMLEDLLCDMLTEENIKHFVFIPPKNRAIWPQVTESGEQVWGYVKLYHWISSVAYSPCLVLPRDFLLEYVYENVLGAEDYEKALASFHKNRPEYMHATLNARIRFPDEKDSTLRAAYRLRIDHLPVPEAERHRLLRLVGMNL